MMRRPMLVLLAVVCVPAWAGDDPEAHAKKVLAGRVHLGGTYRKAHELTEAALKGTGVPWIFHPTDLATSGHSWSFGGGSKYGRSWLFSTMKSVYKIESRTIKGVMVLTARDGIKPDGAIHEETFCHQLAAKLLDTCHERADARDRAALTALAGHIIKTSKTVAATKKALRYAWLAPHVLGTAADQRVSRAPLTHGEKARVAKLVEQLGAKRWKERVAASRALEAFGRRVLPAVRLVSEHENLEIRDRIKALVEVLTRPVPFRLCVLEVEAVEGNVVRHRALRGRGLPAGEWFAARVTGPERGIVEVSRVDGVTKLLSGKLVVGDRVALYLPAKRRSKGK